MASKSSSKRGWPFGCGILLLIISGTLLLLVILELIDEPSSNVVIAVICFSILTILGILLILKGRQKDNVSNEMPHENEQKEADINKLLSKVRRGNLGILKFTGIEPDLIRQRDEKVFFMMPNINLIEHTTMQKISGGGGISLAGFGLSSEVSSERQEVKEVLDNGKLTLTNNRLVFDGEKRSSETMLTDILVITPYSNGIGLKSGAREKVQYFVIVSPKQCTAQITCGERIYKEPINGKWLAAIIEGAIHSRENIEEVEEGRKA
ncbi:MAG: hypothetical protein GH159_04380 [Dehalococcoidia bacterium]|nr:hypothetical protein [Dehalococcoidia bacterium]